MIEEIYIHSYGKLREKKWKLEPGLQVICGHNEAGKSTATSFVRAMLYGLPVGRSRSILENDRKRYLPWNGEAFSGSLTWRMKDGRRYTVSRSFGMTPHKDRVQVVDADTGEVQPWLEDNMGAALFGVSAETFENTAMIRQDGGRVERNDELVNKVSNLVTSAQEDVGYESTSRALKAKRDALRRERGHNGVLDELEKEEQQLQQRLQEMGKAYDTCLGWMEELNQVEHQLEQASTQLEGYKGDIRRREMQQQAEDYGRIVLLRQEINNLRSSMELIKKSISRDGFQPDVEYVRTMQRDLQSWEESQRNLREAQEEWNELNAQAQQAGQMEEGSVARILEDCAQARALQARLEALGTELEEKQPLVQRRQELQWDIKRCEDNMTQAFRDPHVRTEVEILLGRKVQKVQKGRIALLAAGAVAALLATLWKPWAGIIILVALVAWMMLADKGTVPRSSSGALMRQLGVGSKQELATYYREWQIKDRQAAELRAALAEVERSLASNSPDRLMTEQRTTKEQLLAIFRRCQCSGWEELQHLEGRAKEAESQHKVACAALQRSQNKVQHAQRRQEECRTRFLLRADKAIGHNMTQNGYHKELDQLMKQCTRLVEREVQQREKEAFLARLVEGKDMEKLREAYQQMQHQPQQEQKPAQQQKADNTQAVMALTSRRSELETRIGHYFEGEEAVTRTRWQLEETQKELKKREREYHALCMASQVLEEAMEELSRQVSPKLTRMVGEHLSHLTGGKHQKLLLDQQYHIRLCGADGVSRPLESFSRGTVDQVYLALRLALVQVVSNGEMMPFLLDDSFVRYDDARLKTALRELARMADKGMQILLFTCQKRELALLDEMEIPYHRLEL